MPLPTLEDMTPALDDAAAQVLGETIRFRPAGADLYRSLKAHVDYTDGDVDMGGGILVAQSIRIALPKVEAPVKPSSAVRIRLTHASGAFKPVNVASDESGTHWTFGVEEMPDG